MLELDSEATAFILIDMQNDFCAPEGAFARSGVDVSPAQRILPVQRRLVAGARQGGVPVIFLVSEYASPNNWYLSPTFVAQARRRWNGRHTTFPVCPRGTFGADFFAGLRPQPGDAVVWKHRPDGFIDTDLDTILRSRGIRSLVVAGMTTEVCVESTVRHAFCRDYTCFVPRDAVAAYDPEMHEHALRALDRFFAEVVDAAQVLEAWMRRRDGRVADGTERTTRT